MERTKAPSVYLYGERDNQFQLYLGEYSTVAGLSLFDPEFVAQIQHIYTDKSVDQDTLLRLTTVAALTKHLGDESNSPYDFAVKVEDGIQLSTHDDGECYFVCSDQDDCERLLRAAAPGGHGDRLWEALTSKQGQYITIDPKVDLTIYMDFDAYLGSKNIAE